MDILRRSQTLMKASMLRACSLPVLGNLVAFSLQSTMHSCVTSGAGCGVTTFKADQLLIPLILLK